MKLEQTNVVDISRKSAGEGTSRETADRSIWPALQTELSAMPQAHCHLS